MSNHNYSVKLSFTADTTLAQSNIQSLSNLLQKISFTKIGFDSGDLSKAASAAQELSYHLQYAMNQDTGKLDLRKLNNSLKSTGSSLANLSSSLIAVGPAGQQAFTKIAAAIAQAETPMYRMSQKTKDLINTLGNTIKWQMASTAIHGVTGAIKESISYIEKFDKALVDISMVSNLSNQELLKYAEETHKVAEKIGSTSLDVAKGSTIYFQQGLDVEQVAERVEITTKMANVTGENVEKVSSQLTAIWNNFDEQGASLEDYADKLAYLGATTAADTDQIATAMQKFAASAKTVGLSYDYAATAVAKVIDKTQLAPEEVGTAFKSIFSRIQSLELGETLEDGVDLNKYSEALETVGVQVLDANGGLRDANDILNDLGATWETLDGASKKALATTVGGLRQQTQFIALMDSWGDISATVDELGASTEYLNIQNEKYKNGVEGVKKTYEEAKQALFESLISEDSVKGFYKGLTSIISAVEHIVDAFGGIDKMLLILIGVFSKQLFPIIQNGLSNATTNILTFFGYTDQSVKKIQAEFDKEIQLRIDNGELDETSEKSIRISQQLRDTKERLTKASQNMSEAEKQIVANQIALLEYSAQQLQNELDKLHAMEEQAKIQKEQMVSSSRKAIGERVAENKFRAAEQEKNELYEKDPTNNQKGFSVEQQNEIVENAKNRTLNDMSTEIMSIRENNQNTINQKQADLEAKKARLVQLNTEQQDLEATRQVRQNQLDVAYDDPNVDRKDAYQLLKDNTATLSDGTKIKGTHAIGKHDQTDGDNSYSRVYSEVETLTGQIVDNQKEIDSLIEEIEQGEKDVKDTEEQISQEGAERISTLEKSIELQKQMNSEAVKVNENTVITQGSIEFGQDKDLKGRELGQKIFNAGLEGKAAMSFDENAQEQSISYDASIENYATLAQKKGELASATNSLNLMDKEWSKTLETAKNNVNKVNREIDNNASKNKKATKEQQQAKNELKNSAKQAKSFGQELATLSNALKLDDNYIKKINAALKQLDSDDPKEVAAALEFLDNTFKDVSNGVKVAGANIDLVLENMESDLAEVGLSGVSLEQLENALKQLGLWTSDVERRFQQLKGTMSGASVPTASLNTQITNVTSGLATMASSAQMAFSAWRMLSDGWGSGMGTMEAIITVLSTMSMILPTIAAVTKAVTAAKKLENAEDAKSLGVKALKIAMTFKETVAKYKEAGATMLQATWQAILNAVRTMGVAGIAVAVAAIGLATVAVVGLTSSTKDATEAELENQDVVADGVQKTQELTQKYTEQIDTLDALVHKYNELKAAGKDVIDVEQQIIDSVPDMIAEYKELAKELGISSNEFDTLISQMDNAAAAGDVEKIEATADAIDTLLSPEALKTSKRNFEDAGESLVNAVGDAQNKTSGGDRYKLMVASGYMSDATEYDYLQTAKSRYSNLKFEGFDSEFEEGHNGDKFVSVDMSSPQKLIASYEELLSLKEDMARAGMTETDSYKAIEQVLSETKEMYDTYTTAADSYSEQRVYAAKAALETEKDMSLSSINSYQEYQDYKKALLNDSNIKGDPDAEKAAEDWLKANAAIKEYADTDKKIGYIGDTLGSVSQSQVENFYKNLNEEDQKIFIEVVPTLTATDAASLNTALQEAYDEAGKKEIVTYDIEAEEYENYLDLLENRFPNAYEDNAKGANEVAKANLRLDKGVETLSESWEDYNEAMTSGSLTDVSKVLPDIKKSIQNILNLDTEQFELLPDDFAEKNWQLIDDVVHGVEGSVDELRDIAGQEILLNIEGAVDSEGNIKNDLLELHNSLASADDMKFEVGVAIDDTDFIDACNEMIATAGMTADEAKSYFASMGYDVELQEVEPKATTTTWKQDGEYFDFATGKTKKISTKGTSTQFSPPAYAIKTITPNGSYGGGIGVNTTPSPSTIVEEDNSGSSEDNTPEVVKKSDTVERYKEINDQLEDISRNLDKINDKMDDAYGQARLDAIDEYIATLEEENKALEKKGQEIERNISEDQQTVVDAAAGVGMSVEFDENGNIANATQIEEAWYARLASATTKDEQDEIQGYIDIWEDAQGDYEDSLNEFWDNEDAKRENRRKQQEKEFEKWNYKIELDVELDEGELALIDYYQNKLSDDIYGMAESVALTGQEVDITLGNLADREKQYAELTSLYESGKISQAQYAEGLKELQAAELEDLETLQQLQEEMEEYYANTLAMASEELDKYTARLERSTAMLEHYQDLLDLTGQGQNYDAMGKVLDAQQRTINNQYESSKKEYEMYKRQADDSYQKMLNATTDEDRERYKKEWEEAEQYANDAQDRTVDNAKKKAEIAAAIYENTLNRLNKQMETALTNGRSFDEVSIQMEHQQSLQEEYLTTTNKIYETTKMMRNLQNEIDKTTNRVAKQKLKAFQQETKQLQEQGKLSKFELDIQQAKYDLLLAEIALEEAQNAKSTVRLQRDSEGNFGYVYTADQEKVSGAEQAVDDAENALYNVQLEGANNYAEQSFQLQQEGLDALKELNESYRAGDITSEEEYQRRREEIINYYTQRLTDISNLYGIAVADDSRVAADAWSTNITDLVADADTWKTETNKYTSEVDQAFSTLNTELAKIADEMGLNIEDLTATISNVTEESDKWAKEMQDDVIPDMEDTIDEVKTLADALLKKLTPQIKDAAKKGEILAEKMYKTQKKLSGLAGEAEKSASRAANVAGQWRRYWDAVNNSDGGGDTIDDYPPGPNDNDDDSKKTSNKSSKPRFSTGSLYYTKDNVGYAWVKSVDNTTSGYIRSDYLTKNSDGTYSPKSGGALYANMIKNGTDSRGRTIFYPDGYMYSYDTGGYTGEWGSEGKLAALHEKELVLNKEDTANFLASLELLHNIIKMIDINTSNSLISRLDSAELKTNKSNDVLEQHVTIEAVFPNVEDRYEIEEAFMNLTNEASQYINRKNN